MKFNIKYITFHEKGAAVREYYISTADPRVAL
jgi:hypothetical protein